MSSLIYSQENSFEIKCPHCNESNDYFILIEEYDRFLDIPVDVACVHCSALFELYAEMLFNYTTQKIMSTRVGSISEWAHE